MRTSKDSSARVLPMPDRGVFLQQIAGGALYYRGGEDGEAGIWLDQGKKGGRYLLQAPLQMQRTSAGKSGFCYTLEVTPPGHAPVVVEVTRDTIAEGACWDDLRGLLRALPVTKADNEATLAALNCLAIDQGARLQRLADALGWQMIDGRRYWIATNGALDGARRYTADDAPALAGRANMPQTLPAGAPGTLDAAPIVALLDFWPRDVSLFPLAALGACAEVCKPYADTAQPGRAPYDLELFGPSGIGKTALLNFLMRLFSGAGFERDTAPQIKATARAADTAIGELYMRRLLAYHPYLDQDANARPGHDGYERQQARRLEMNAESGDQTGGGERGRRRGGSEARPSPSGLLIRQGEPSPYDYSVAHHAESQDARAVTFLVKLSDEQTEAQKARVLTVSPALWRLVPQADALRVAWLQYLARQTSADLQARRDAWACEDAQTFRTEQARQGAPIHSRAQGQVISLVCGLREYARFLRASGARQGAQAARLLESSIGALIAERITHAAWVQSLYNSQGTTTEASEAQRLAQALYTLAGKHHVTDRRGEMPAKLSSYVLGALGWLRSSSELDGRRPRGGRLFWLDDGLFYVQPAHLRERLQAEMRLSYAAPRLRELLQEAGMLAPGQQQGTHANSMKRGPDGNARYLALRLDGLLDDPEQDDQGAAPSVVAPAPEPAPAAPIVAAPVAVPLPLAAEPAAPAVKKHAGGRPPKEETEARVVIPPYQDLLRALPAYIRNDEQAIAAARAYDARGRRPVNIPGIEGHHQGAALFAGIGRLFLGESAARALGMRVLAALAQYQPAAPGAAPA